MDIVINMTGVHSFLNNSILQRGAIAMFGAKMMPMNPFQANFIENYVKCMVELYLFR